MFLAGIPCLSYPKTLDACLLRHDVLIPDCNVPFAGTTSFELHQIFTSPTQGHTMKSLALTLFLMTAALPDYASETPRVESGAINATANYQKPSDAESKKA